MTGDRESRLNYEGNTQPEVKKQDKKKEKKEKKKKRPLHYKVMIKKGKIPDWQYYILLSLAIIVEFFKMLIKGLFLVGLVAFLLIGALFLKEGVPILSEWKNEADEIVANSSASDFQVNQSSTVYYADGTVMATLREAADQEYISYEDIPQYVIDAFVAVEDQDFWENNGIDVKGIVRVCVNYVLSSGEEAHGASTITQQLARNVYLTHEVSLARKGKEIFIALAMTEKYSKEDIMEFYVNDICYANGIYGIAGAAKAYFNKSVDELTLSECAYLCAIPNSPTYYDPYVYPERALERRDKILGNMLECGYITEKEYNKAIAEEIVIEKPTYEYNNYETTYAVDCAVQYLMELDGFEFEYTWDSMDDYNDYLDTYNEAYSAYKHALYTGGYEIYTSIDKETCEEIQEILDEQLAFNEEIDEDTGIYALQGAVTVVDNETRKVVAIVGGRSQDEISNMYSLNRAYQSYRQPGSTFKPLAVYTPALENGYRASTIVENIDVSEAKEKGVDVQSLTGTKMTLRSAVVNSKNGVAWKIFDWLTPQVGLSYVTDMHFSKIVPDDYYDSASLGGLTYGVTTVEMAEAYSTLANHGDHVDATCLVSLIDSDGTELYEEPETIEVYTDKAADDMVDILKGVLTNGTASSLKWKSSSDIQAFAKTGTTNDSKDGWLCGATPYYSIAVWVGYDTPQTLNNLYGATYPGNIWKECMLAVTEGLEAASFTRNSTDSSYVAAWAGTNYYNYLPGRDDDEVLSNNYTVANYREDRVVGESVLAIAAQMSSYVGESDELNSLYSQAHSIILEIYSASYASELQQTLNAAYDAAIIRGQEAAGLIVNEDGTVENQDTGGE